VTKVRAKHPVSRRWRVGELLGSKGREVTVRFRGETVVVSAENVRPVVSTKRGR
jgi:hypothetical protein